MSIPEDYDNHINYYGCGKTSTRSLLIYNAGNFISRNNRFGRPSQTAELATVSVYNEPTAPSGRKYQQAQSGSARRNGFRPKSDNAVDSNSSRDSRRTYKPKASPAQADQASTSLYKFKLSRPVGR